MPLPSNLQTITVTGSFLDTTGAPLSGTLSFTPPVELVDVNNAALYPTPVTATLDSSGHFSVTLICTDNPTLEPAGWYYTVAESVRTPRSYPIFIPHTLGSSVDISTLMPAPVLPPAPAGLTSSAALTGYAYTAYNNTFSGTNAFQGEVTVPTPVNPTDAVTKAYADAITQGLSVKFSCQEATTAALPGNVYANGTAGVGATLTASANGALTVDGVAVSTGDRVLVMNEATASHNGIYLVTNPGTTGAPYVLTRSPDMNTPASIAGAFVFVEEGTANSGSGFVVASPGPFTIGTTAISWTIFSISASLAGAGLVKSGNTLSLTVASLGLNVTGVKTGAYTLAAQDWVPVSVAGGNVSVTLPQAPANGTRVGIKMVANNAAGNGMVSILTQGSDTFNTASGPTTGTLSLTSQGMLLQYSGGIWYVQADDLPLGQLDLRYQKITVVPAATGVNATDAANIAAAITAAGVGGTLYFPWTATSYVADQLTPLANQTWFGFATILRPASSTNSVISATGIANFAMRDLTIDGNRANSTATSNAALYFTNCTWTRLQGITVQNCPSANSGIIMRGPVRALIENSQFSNCGYAIGLGLMHGDSYSCYGNVIRGCTIDTTDMDAIFLSENLGSNTGISVIGSVIGTVVSGCTVRNAGDCGIEVGSGTVYTTVTGCSFVGISNGVGNNGILFRDAAHATTTGCTVSNYTKTGSTGVYLVDLNGSCTDIDINVNVTNCGYGIIAVGGTSPTAIGTAHKNVNINGGTIDTTSADGIQLTNVAGFSITGTQVYGAGNQGISIGKYNTASSGSTSGTITGVRVFNSSQANSGSYSGIVLFQNSADITIVGGAIGDTQGSHTQGYGIRIFDATVTNVKISGVDCTNGGTAANFSNAAGTAQGIEVYNCTGISPVGLRSAITRQDNDFDPADHGLIAWTYPGRLWGLSSGTPISGVHYMMGLQIRAPFTTTKAYTSMSSTGLTPTAGQNFIALWNSTGVLCASVEIDSILGSGGTTGLQTLTWASSFTGPAGFYWLSMLVNCATNPTIYRGPGTADNATPNVGITTASQYVICKNGTGLTALPSSPLTLTSNSISSSSDSPRCWAGAIG